MKDNMALSQIIINSIAQIYINCNTKTNVLEKRYLFEYDEKTDKKTNIKTNKKLKNKLQKIYNIIKVL